MPKIISIANQKGGVGKTTTTVNLAAALAVEKNKKVLCIDFDPQSNLSDYLGYIPQDGDITISELMSDVVNGKEIHPLKAIKHSENNKVDYIPSNIVLSSAEFFLSSAISRETVLKRILENEELSDYDYIIIDCLPSLSILLINALSATNEIIIPVQAQKFSLDGLKLFMPVYEQVRRNINMNLKIKGILLTMSDNTNMAKAVNQCLVDEYKDLVFETKIHRSVEATNSTYEHKSMIFSKSSKLGKEYLALANEIIK